MRFAASALVLFASIIGSSPAYAEGWTGDLTIHMAFTEDSDLLVVSTTDGTQYTPGCGSINGLSMLPRRNDAHAPGPPF